MSSTPCCSDSSLTTAPLSVASAVDTTGHSCPQPPPAPLAPPAPPVPPLPHPLPDHPTGFPNKYLKALLTRHSIVVNAQWRTLGTSLPLQPQGNHPCSPTPRAGLCDLRGHLSSTPEPPSNVGQPRHHRPVLRLRHATATARAGRASLQASQRPLPCATAVPAASCADRGAGCCHLPTNGRRVGGRHCQE